jgi:hypothetical protein
MASAANEDEASVRLLCVEFALRGFALDTSLSRVFHSPHAAHCPCHFGADAPQFWQTNTSLDFAMGSLNTVL